MTETLYIRDARSLVRLAERLEGVEELALDTEFLRERTYFPKLCLLQLASREVLALVDPLVVEDLGPLWGVVCGGAEIVLHAGGQDLEIIQRLAGRLPARVFDTQLAAAFVGLGDSIGYARLVEAILGRGPKRSEAYTDWSRRPLTPAQQEYALDDVRYLLECADQVRERVAGMGRLAWVEEESRVRLAAVCHSPEAREQWRRIKGGRSLSGRALAVLQEAAAWREEEAIRRDVPRQRVLADRVLVEIARRAPRNPEQVAKLRGLHPREAQRSSGLIVALVQRAVQRLESEWPTWPELPPLADDPNVDAAASLLDAVVKARAERMQIASRLLATRADLTLLVRLALQDGAVGHGRDEPALLQGWRREFVGEDLLALLRGERAVRLRRGRDGLSLDLD